MTVNSLFCALILATFDTSCSQEGSYGLVTWPHEVPLELQPQVEDNVTAVSWNSGAFAALAGGKVVTWGNPDDGGDSSAVEAKLRSNVTAIFRTSNAFAALKAGGEVVAWGYEWYGGDSSAVGAKLRSNVTTIFSNFGAFAALKAGGEVVTWGWHINDADSSAVEAKLRSNVTTIFSTDSAFAALKTGGEVVTWGFPFYGGNSSAVEAKLRSNVTTIFRNSGAFAALKAGGEVVTWGNPGAGGNSSAVEAKLRSNVTTIFSTCCAFAALKSGGEVVTWGGNYGGDSSAVEAKLRSNVTTIFSTFGAFAALKAGGEVVTWGDEYYGGNSSAVEAKLRSNLTTIFSNDFAFAALKAGGEVVTWGSDENGGDSSAVEAKLRSNVTTISSTDSAFAALKVGGEVITWGSRDFGGNSSAVKADISRNVTAVFATAITFAALKTGGEVVYWGEDRDTDFPEHKLKRRVAGLIPLREGFAALICIPHRPSGIDSVSKCEPCNHGKYWKGIMGSIGKEYDQCGLCEDEAEVPTPDQSACKPCGTGFVPHEKRVCIECPNRTFKKVAEVGRPVCELCPMGAVPLNDKSSCKPCPSDQVAEYGICKSCAFLSKPSNDKAYCVSDGATFFAVIVFVILIFMLVKFLFMLSSRDLVIIDVSSKHGKIILTTLTKHNLSSPSWRLCFPIQVFGTGNYYLENGETVANARVASSNSLELLDDKGNSIDRRLDTSRGTVRLSLADSFMLVSLRSIIPLVLPAMAIIAVLPPFALHNFTGAETGFMTLGAVLASSTVCELMRRCKPKTPLQKKLEEFRKWLSNINPKPTSCPIGAGRAIRLDKLLETHNFFRSFIQDRNAYYLSSNILQPLTAAHRLSYAELVGPEQLDFFVSHFWGTAFSYFCAALEKHAEMAIIPGSKSTVKLIECGELHAQIHHVAYWICFCSNNQYAVHHELGGDAGWKESSFYLALQSPSCQSSCMVLDDKALPLTRSWCIFETLQALKHSKSRPGFDLLMCTSSGVLNFGNASVESAMGVVRCVSDMDLQNAKASQEHDKQMIDQLVLSEMGSFDALNSFIQEEIHIILKHAQKACTLEFDSLNKVLETSRQERSVPQAHSYGCALEEVGEIRPPEKRDEMPTKQPVLSLRIYDVEEQKKEYDI